MKSIDSHLSALKFPTLEFTSTFEDGLLFPVDVRVATEQRKCPYCFRVLYEMRNRPFWYCKAKTHKRFIIGKDKIRCTK